MPPGQPSLPDRPDSIAPPSAATAPVVTAVRKAGRGRVAIELDGAPWRVLPLEAVVGAGVVAGVPLDRVRARRLRTELRRVEARSAALSALSHRDHTAASLRERLQARGVAPAQREAAMATLEQAGLVDDTRVARSRAAVLARRGSGNAMIRDDLEGRGVAADVAEDAIAGLEPEIERARRLCRGTEKLEPMLRRLAARGFEDDVIAAVIADQHETELG